MTRPDPLDAYRRKRDFTVTPEPQEGGETSADALRFVVQKHWASRLHYDLRLEIDGTMKSWAVPKGPSLDPHDKRMAVQVEDHPIAYNLFEGDIPPKQYGAGKVIVWDKGTWAPQDDPARGWKAGKLKFALHGHKLHGHWTLVRMHGKRAEEEKQPPWLLIKENDIHARSADAFDVVEAQPDSVGCLPDPAVPRASSRAENTGPDPVSPIGCSKAAAPARPPRGKAAALPESLSPQLATLASAPPTDTAAWIFELKFDGYRLLARKQHGNVRLFTRNGLDWTARMPKIAAAVEALPFASGWLDGEVVVLGADGAPDFQALQNAFERPARRCGVAAGIVYYVFDLAFHGGEDLRPLPLDDRRARLQAMLGGRSGTDSLVRFSEAFDAPPGDLAVSACKLGFEGVIGKRRDAPYTGRRSADWIKLKCGKRQEFVIGGYTDPKGSRQGLGSLLLGVHDDDGTLRYAGNVGTGFSEHTLQTLHEALAAQATEQSPFADTDGIARGAHWVRPVLLAEVSFAQWTRIQRIRHAVFQGLRSDKPARVIVQERSMAIDSLTKKDRAARKNASDALPIGMKVTHGDRVVDPKSGLRKIDLVRYYATVAPLMLEHMQGRPTSFVRAPSGVDGELFFQKHAEGEGMPAVRRLDPALDPGHAPLLEVASADALLQAVQMNVLEFHTWNARHDRIERPDRMTFDIDPGEGVPWEQVQQAAVLVRVALEELGLPAFLKTSGGKGLHVVVPIKRLHGWDAVKGFSEAVARHLARTIPSRFVAKSGPRNRVGKIYVDFLRNGRGATTVAAWSARSRPGMGISVPLEWDELETLTSGAHWTVRTVDARLRPGNAPWAGYAAAAVSLTPALKVLARNGGRA
ncbi:DNA ligase D [Xylophilus ampelinus]|uniref:DNA ligase (ATP) n=1 Tax=Xylophilus ampelinus TaxID=54067 RepID=A0A318SM23_9BURK|nr:DNA ligase D [Xylophilus ampelinus]MCS4510076.1 DNA ligase D [Xylophilus ampelinus]PYE78222.1 ATP-dependent DNA ligase LigD phosphoesterase module /ATP-dependent DNA ligase LigD polymerase module [Xylophilus ampelinus]